MFEIKRIAGFRKEHYYLSNFYKCKVEFEGITYDNAEAAFQAQKVLEESEKREFIGLGPKQAKKLGRKVELRSDWESVKLKIMLRILVEKFTQNEELGKKLVSTGKATLIEENWWGDTFWGVSRGKGSNHLGKLLMQTREIIK